MPNDGRPLLLSQLKNLNYRKDGGYVKTSD